MTAALHLVPDDEPTPPSSDDTAGEEHPGTAPVLAVDETAGEESPGDIDEELEEYAEDDELAPRRALALPDLRPYTNLMWIPAVINAGIEATRRHREGAPERKAMRRARKAARRTAGELPAGRSLLFFVIDLGLGSWLLIRRGSAWARGEGGPKNAKPQHRLIMIGAGVYCSFKAVSTWPDLAPFGLVDGWFVASIAVRQHAVAQVRKKDQKKPASKSAATVENRPGPPPAEDSSEDAVEASVEAMEQAFEEDPLTALIRAEIGSENGVHLADLRPAMRAALPTLSQATDEQLREVLTAAGYDPSKKFRARGYAGRAGVPRNQLPPLPSPEGAPAPLSGPGLRSGDAGQMASAESSGEKRGVVGEERRGAGERDFEIVQDLERGPSAWRIVHHGEGEKS